MGKRSSIWPLVVASKKVVNGHSVLLVLLPGCKCNLLACIASSIQVFGKSRIVK